jgi:hypothetical protein
MSVATDSKRVTESQMAWMFRKGFAWYAPGDQDFRSPIYTSSNVYYWVVPFINRDRQVDGGYYEAE